MPYQTEKKARVLAFFREEESTAHTIEAVCRAVIPDGRGKSTVYRIVSEMAEDGTLRKISDPTSRHCAYQYVGGAHCAEHLHLKCTACGRLIHLDEGTSQALENALLSRENFALDEGAMLFGTCASCRHKCKSFFTITEKS